MAVNWNGDAAKRFLGEATAEGLLMAAVYFQTQHKNRLNLSNPPPYLNSSKPGEYPRARTGFGRDNTAYDPETKAAVYLQQSVRIGYRTNAEYMAILEVFRGRLGLLKTMESIRGQVASIAEQGAKKGGP